MSEPDRHHHRPRPSLAEAALRLKRAALPCQTPSRSDLAGLPVLILMTDPVRLPDPAAAIGQLPRGTAVIFRDYEAPDRAATADRLRRLCRQRRLVFLVAGDWRLALAVRADGLHLPEGRVRHGDAVWRRARRPGFLITQAAHGRRAIAAADRRGIDAVLLAPVFATASHADAKPLGPIRFARLVRLSPLPVYALGGMTPGTARRLRGIRIAGIAAIGALIPQRGSQPSS